MVRRPWPKLLLALTFLATAFAGCADGGSSPSDAMAGERTLDVPLRLPTTDFYNRTGRPFASNITTGLVPTAPAEPFHTYEELAKHVAEYAEKRPDLARVETIGKSRQERPLWDVILTDSRAAGPKTYVLIDGGHHGNEIAGTELALYVIDFLLENADANATVRRMLETLEIHVVPLVNPDGYVAQTRGNALGVNLNRNYDVDWGNPYGASNPVMGQLSARTGQPVQSVGIVAENCGDRPFSEPESRAIRDLMERLHGRLAFYLTHHTPTNGVVAPWSAGDPPFEIPARDAGVFEAELAWIRKNTEYAAGKAQWGNFSAGLPYSASGSSQDWAYLRHGVAAYTLEVEIWITSITDPDYLARNRAPYAGLPYWMKATLPIPWHLLVNSENYAAWQPPDAWVPLPAGVPPPVPRGGWESLGNLGYAKPDGEIHDEDPGAFILPAFRP